MPPLRLEFRDLLFRVVSFFFVFCFLFVSFHSDGTSSTLSVKSPREEFDGHVTIVTNIATEI